MGIAPQHLLELDQRMLKAITMVYEQKAKAVDNAKRGVRRRS